VSVTRNIVLTLVLSALAAAIGAWGGGQYVARRMHHATSLHQIVHQKLDLTPEQERRIDELERDYAVKRRAREAEMRAANAELAQAIQERHSYTPEVQAAIDRFHMAMGALQKESIQHVIAMRAVLTPEQAARFDDTVVKALTEQAQ
jgi:Spy/CpxP family protein refolding chaperone